MLEPRFELELDCRILIGSKTDQFNANGGQGEQHIWKIYLFSGQNTEAKLTGKKVG